VTAAEVLALVVSIARAFGLAVTDVVAYARQAHPVLRTEALPDVDAVDAARAEAVERVEGGA